MHIESERRLEDQDRQEYIEDKMRIHLGSPVDGFLQVIENLGEEPFFFMAEGVMAGCILACCVTVGDRGGWRMVGLYG